VNEYEFRRQLLVSVPRGMVFQNPGGGTSEVVSLTDENLCYRRRNSNITVAIGDLYRAYANFAGGRLSSRDLRAFMPRVFDSTQSGHSCNCTMLFMLLQHLHLCDSIEGRGVAGDPFWVETGAL
jgi:hypothetical protein